MTHEHYLYFITLKMFFVLTLTFVANIFLYVLGVPVELELQHDMKDFLDSRIVGGIDAPREYGKHMAALVWGENTMLFMCGGSIVSKYHILSAAHCIDPMVVWGQLISSFRGVIGSHRWATTQSNVRFKGFINHPGWDWATLKNDIGVLYLAEKIRLDAEVAVIPLNFDWVGGATKTYVTGWGRIGTSRPFPETLQLLYLYTITPLECLEGIRAAAEWWGSSPPFDFRLEICTFHSFGHGMCNCDSGSALVQKSTQKQIGIVSWGFPCARGAPDVFVRISAFENWLKQILGHHLSE